MTMRGRVRSASLFLLLFSFVLSGAAQADWKDWVSRHTDPGFSGWYLKIDTVMRELGVTRFQAHEIQNLMRDDLERRAESFSPLKQAPYVQEALERAIHRVKSIGLPEASVRGLLGKQNLLKGKGLEFRPGEFVVVFDMDETLLVQWWKHGHDQNSPHQKWFSDGSEPYFVKNPEIAPVLHSPQPDSVPALVDRKSGTSAENPEILYSSSFVQLRPEAARILNATARLPNCRGVILFTAKEDRAAFALLRSWKLFLERNANPEDNPFKNGAVIGVLTRNHLKYDDPETIQKPSKDLRLIDPSLENIFLVDDNESRVLQKDLNYRIPKFNADLYLDSYLNEENKAEYEIIRKLNNVLLDHAFSLIFGCATQAAQKKGVGLKACFQKIGRLSDEKLSGKDAELRAYLKWLKEEFEGDTLERRISGITIRDIHQWGVFEQPFEIVRWEPARAPFPRFEAGVQKELLPVN